jgi:hypothetical protein
MSKPKKCKVCKSEFEPFSSLQTWCSPDCGYELSKRKEAAKIKSEAKEFRKETKRRKEALKSKSEWLEEAQRECNKYIRLRDKGKGCISCGTTNPNIQYCAGHFKTRGGHPELRFHPMNIHLQCNHHCNLQKSGNIEKYRPELIKRIGILQVEWLEGKHEAQNLSIDDIKEIKVYYREQIKLIPTN